MDFFVSPVFWTVFVSCQIWQWYIWPRIILMLRIHYISRNLDQAKTAWRPTSGLFMEAGSEPIFAVPARRRHEYFVWTTDDQGVPTDHLKLMADNSSTFYDPDIRYTFWDNLFPTNPFFWPDRQKLGLVSRRYLQHVSAKHFLLMKIAQ